MAKYLPVEELDVYRLAEQMSDAIWTMVERWTIFPRDTLGKQLVRCADSVGANIAEGGSDGNATESRRFVRYARRSLREVRFFLRRAHSRQLMSEAEVANIRPLIDELRPRLQAYYKSICRRCESTQHNDTTSQQHNKDAQ